MLNDNLANTFSKVLNASKVLKSKVSVKKTKLTLNVLDVLKKYEYVESYEIENDGKSGIIHISLNGNINKLGVIKPRFPIKSSKIEDEEKRYLPAKDFGIVIISTSKGLMTQFEVKQNKLGGKLLAYCY